MWAATVINPKVKIGESPDLTYTLRLFRNGRRVFSGEERKALTGDAGRLDPKHMAIAGTVKLSANTTPGEYVLQIIVSDKRVKKNATVSQWIDFDVKPPAAEAPSGTH